MNGIKGGGRARGKRRGESKVINEREGGEEKGVIESGESKRLEKMKMEKTISQ